MSDEKKNLETGENTPEKATAPAVTATTEATNVDAIKLEELVENQDLSGTAHDDFDWDKGNRHALPYSASEVEAYLKEYDSTLTAVLEGEIVKGKVSSISSGDIVLDINYKSDGLVPLSEFRDMPDLGVGDHVEVYVEKQEDERGQLILSRRKAKLLRSWESIVAVSYTHLTLPTNREV